MALSYICFTVSNLSRSCDFYASLLQPLGYRYIGEVDSQIGFGVEEATFFIREATNG